MIVEASFIAGAEAGMLCELVDRSGNRRIVEPYMVYRSSRGKRLFHLFQIAGYSESGNSVGWKNPKVDSFERATLMGRRFRQRPEYNPANSTMFPEIYFAIAKGKAAGA